MEQRPGNPGKDPLTLADNPIGQWNTLRIIQVADHGLPQRQARRGPCNPGKLLGSRQSHPGQGPNPGLVPRQRIPLADVEVREVPAEEANAILASMATRFSTIFGART